jgi:hypothetical protein
MPEIAGWTSGKLDSPHLHARQEIVGWTSPASCKHEEEIDYIPTIIFI